MKLPVENILDELKASLEVKRNLVIQAPPGAGKTTIVPLALLNEKWLAGRKIIMLEPRRIAVRASAYRMAELLNEDVGGTVGYHVSMDKCTGPDTRIEVVTEGIWIRRIQNDPSLEDVGLVIFDEFHERSLNSDLGLALTIESSEVFSDTLRIIAMSATLNVDEIAGLMGDTTVLTSQGKCWPVETKYIPCKNKNSNFRNLEKQCTELIKRVFKNHEGDILVFLPGAGEIKRVEVALNADIKAENLFIIPLYGKLTKRRQDQAILPSKSGERKIVLATSIAETSVTIDGVTIVIDSGLMRVSKYFSGTGMSRLETINVSKSSADQRRGRAGRTKPGICYRMWEKERHHLLKEYNSPEILNADLTGFILELELWGSNCVSELKMLDYPASSAVNQAKQILIYLGAIDSNGNITRHGKKMAALGIHPRLAHMILKGDAIGEGTLACYIASLLSERDFILSINSGNEADLLIRLEILYAFQNGDNCKLKNIKLNKGVIRRILKNISKFKKAVNIKQKEFNMHKTGTILAFAYPERIMKLRSGSSTNYLMASGAGAFLKEGDPLSLQQFIVAAETDGNPKNSRIYLGAPYSKDELVHDFNEHLETVKNIKWDKKTKSVSAKEELKYGAIVISAKEIKNSEEEIIQSEMIYGIKETGIQCLPWNKKLKSFQARAGFLLETGIYNDLPDISEPMLVESLDDWLKPYLGSISKLAQLKNIDLQSAIFGLFSWEEQQVVEKSAPTHIVVPSGSKIPLQYIKNENAPVLAVRLQELFGLKNTPTIANGKVAVTIHLLSPASRPVQVTNDLRSFWENTYFEVKKELMGRYPKHYWPDDPFKALPTNKTKKAR